MHNRRLFFTQAAIILGVGAVHVLAIQWYLYWQFLWLDIPVHFFSGAWVSLLVVWIFGLVHRTPRLLESLLWVLLFGIGWELFELWGGIPIEDNFRFDTTVDLLMDLLGGFVGYLWAKRIVDTPPHEE